MRKIGLFVVLGIFMTFLLSCGNSEKPVASSSSLDVTKEEVEESEISSEAVLETEEETLQIDISVYSRFENYYQLLTDEEKLCYRLVENEILNMQKEIDVRASHAQGSSLERILFALEYDHPEYFWVDLSAWNYSLTADGEVLTLDLQFYDFPEDVETAKSIMEEEMDAVILEAASLDTLGKIRYIHDYIGKTVRYNETSAFNQSLYSALRNHETVCAGYTKLFQYYMQKIGVDNMPLRGSLNSVNHAWNLVLIDDDFYEMDMTIDADGGEYNDHKITTYSYYLKTTEEMAADHERDSAFTCPTATGTTFSFETQYGITSDEANTMEAYDLGVTIHSMEEYKQFVFDEIMAISEENNFTSPGYYEFVYQVEGKELLDEIHAYIESEEYMNEVKIRMIERGYPDFGFLNETDNTYQIYPDVFKTSQIAGCVIR